MLVLKVNGRKANAFPVVMLPSAALTGFVQSPVWSFIAVANLILLWTLGWGEAVGGPRDQGQPTRLLRKLANLLPTLGVATAVWSFRQPQPLAFWVTASIYFASVQWLSKKHLDLLSIILGWICLWGLTVGGQFHASIWASLMAYTFCVLLTVFILRLASELEDPVPAAGQRTEPTGIGPARCEGEIGFES